MTIRITGMNSGLDTESIITELASARSVKVQNLEKAQTKLSWKIDAWKELNAKIYSFYTDVLSDMRFDYAYGKKKTTVSDSSVVSVVTSSDAVDGTQKLKVKQLATTAYLTGAKVTAEDNSSVTSSTKASKLGIENDTKLKLTIGGEEQEIEIKTTDTLSDIASKFSEAGLNAKFDESTGRFFISAKESGADAHFDIEAVDDDTDSFNALKALGLNYDGYYTGGDSDGSGATMIEGKDAEIYLNGAKFTSSNNVFEINGLTLTVQKETGDDEITLTTQQDTDSIYDMIKNFITKYNELINEMDKLYNADSASKYEPLTKDEKAEMSDSEIEEWENKIKESLLRRDSTLSSVASVLKNAMLTTYISDSNGKNDGKNKYLSYFGIETLGYFSSKDNEKNAYHIDGNEDDTNVKNNEDKLRAAIANEPEAVVEFFKALSNNLYDALTEKMARTDYSSAFTVYNDKLMDTELSDYTTKISTEQEKLNNYIDKWYEKFSQMEVALSKLNSKESALSSLFG